MDRKRKRNETSAGHRNPSQPQVDPTYGQRSFLPDLSAIDHDNEISMEAIAYLRDVREEASTIPTLLVAPKGAEANDLYDDANDDSRGFYEDGAYVAFRSVDGGSDGVLPYAESIIRSESEADTSVDAATFHHKSLVRRFEHCRRQIRSIPPVPGPGRTPQAWRPDLLNIVPQPAQLAIMPQDTIQTLLRGMPTMIKRVYWLEDTGVKGYRLSIWLWGLLAKLDDRETLSSEEVSDVRELGKRAGSLVLGLDIGLAEDSRDHDELERKAANASFMTADQAVTSRKDSDQRRRRTVRDTRPKIRRRNSSSSISSDEELEAAKRESLLKVRSAAIDSREEREDPHSFLQHAGCVKEESLMATLDMILTIVGECYGQRDLLVARDRLWQR